MTALKDLTGQKFGWLTVVKRATNDTDRGVRWECICACGRLTIARGAQLRTGKRSSCGCKRTLNQKWNARTYRGRYGLATLVVEDDR